MDSLAKLQQQVGIALGPPTPTQQPAHLTMWLLSDSICSSEISRSVVDGTPSSSICGVGQQGGRGGGMDRQHLVASSCSRQHATCRRGAALSHICGCRHARPLAPAPPAASSSAPPACRCSCRAPCTPCRRCPPLPSRFSHSSPAEAQLTSGGSTGERQRRRRRRRSVGPQRGPRRVPAASGALSATTGAQCRPTGGGS